MILVHQYLKDEPRIVAKQLIAYHDETQYQCRPYCAGAFAYKLEDLAVETGLKLGINIPIEAESKIGYNWGETH